MNNNIFSGFLKGLGLDQDETKIFESLTKKGPQTILKLSQATGINRTSLYRIIDRLKKKRLLEEIVEENKILAKAIGSDNLELLLKEKESTVKNLKSAFPLIKDQLSTFQETIQPGTRVLFYRGVEGIKQMVWNTLQAKTELVGYTYRRLDEIVGEKFSREWHDEWILRKLKMRDIFSDEYIKSRKKGHHYHFSDKYFETRYISLKILNINHQVDIYNNQVAYYNWFEGEVFGVEIYNKKISETQRQLFEIVWKMAKPVK